MARMNLCYTQKMINVCKSLTVMNMMYLNQLTIS